jgi:hypothetical protein
MSSALILPKEETNLALPFHDLRKNSAGIQQLESSDCQLC